MPGGNKSGRLHSAVLMALGHWQVALPPLGPIKSAYLLDFICPNRFNPPLNNDNNSTYNKTY
jgi:hypothetical protein